MDLIPTPQTPAERLMLAAAMAAPNLAAKHATIRAQYATPHVYVIAVADAPIGSQFVTGFLGPKAGPALCGPALFAITVERFAALIPEQDRDGVMAIMSGSRDADVRVCLAVNGDALMIRTIPAETWEKHGPDALIAACVEPAVDKA